MAMVQRVAQVFGWIFVVIAVVGFVVTGTSMDPDPATAPRLLGLFPVNVLHNLVHLGFGAWGIVAARSFPAARTYARVAGGIYLVLAVLGFIIPTTFGLIPIGGHDIWLHALIGAALVGAGFMAGDAVPESAPEREPAAAPRAEDPAPRPPVSEPRPAPRPETPPAAPATPAEGTMGDVPAREPQQQPPPQPPAGPASEPPPGQPPASPPPPQQPPQPPQQPPPPGQPPGGSPDREPDRGP